MTIPNDQQRPLRFRAWDASTKKMWVPAAISAEGKAMVDQFGVGTAVDDPVMQSTGLRDKNGVEIFEGDIVDTGERKLEVRWSGCRFWLYGKPRTSLEKMIANQGGEKAKEVGLEMSKWGNCRQTKVVGNIYENPELLPTK